MRFMRSLLENEFPQHYKIGRRRTCAEILTDKSEFDLMDVSTQFVVEYKTGTASFCDSPYRLSVVNYDTYIRLFSGTCLERGRRRCDFILTDTDTDNLILMCELTSSSGGVENLSIPIEKKRKDGSVIVEFPRGKYQKVEQQLYETLDCIMQVPEIQSYVEGKKRKVCLMSYIIKRAEDNAVNAFNRHRIVEAEEAGENGAQISLPCVERYGFSYFRISHKFSFKIG